VPDPAPPPPVPPRPRQPDRLERSGQGGLPSSRYDQVDDGSGVRVTGVVLVAIVLLAAAILVVPGTVGPGLGIAAVGVGVALVLAGLNSPTVAIVLLVVTLFFRQGIKIEELPADPYLFAFAGVLGAGGVALSRQRSRAPEFGAVEGFMALFLMWCIFSAVLPHEYPDSEGNPEHYFILLGVAIPFVLHVVGRAVIDTERSVRVLLWTLLSVWAYSVAHSILQFHAQILAWPDTVASYGDSASWAHRALGVFGNPVENGFLLVVGFVVALYLARTRGTGPLAQIVLYLLCLASLYSIYLTRTRVVYLVFAVALLGAVFLVPRVRALCLGLLGGGFLGALAFAPVLLTSDRRSGGLLSSYEIQDRLNMIATAFWAIGQKPVAGWGITRFDTVNTYHHKQWSQAVPWFRGYGIEAHFLELGIAAELGLVGLALWIPMLLLTFRRLSRAVRRAPRGAELLVGRELVALLAMVGVLWTLVGFTVDLRFLPFANSIVWLLMGVAAGNTDRRQQPVEPAPVPEVLEDDEELYLRWVAAGREA